MRQELLSFVLEDTLQPLQPSLCPVTVRATLALVSMQPAQQGGAACPVPERRWSAAADDETEAKLLYLMRGERGPLFKLRWHVIVADLWENAVLGTQRHHCLPSWLHSRCAQVLTPFVTSMFGSCSAAEEQLVHAE